MTRPKPSPPAVDAELVRRRHLRVQLGIPARLLTLDERSEVRLVNLSQSGARIVLPQAEPVKEGVLEWLGFDTFAIAVWQEGKEVGLEFDRPLPPQWLRETHIAAPEVVREEEIGAARDFVADKSHHGTER